MASRLSYKNIIHCHKKIIINVLMNDILKIKLLFICVK